MTVKRYFATSARDCLRKVKEDLGPDAIVVSNKSVRGGIEITAMSADSLDEISNRAGAAEYVEPRQLLAGGGARHAIEAYAGADDFTVSLSPRARQEPRMPHEAAPSPAQRPIASPWRPPRYEPATGRIGPAQAPPAAPSSGAVPASPPLHRARVADASPSPAITRPQREANEEPRESTSAAAGSVGNLATVHELTHDMRREMQDIRGLLERQLAGFAWGDLSRNSPSRAQLMTELLEVGFSGVLARRLTQDIEPGADVEAARRHVAAVLDDRLRLHDGASDLVLQGGVYALVGPTGVGKTTTAAKLAARGVVRYGAGRVALLTTDGYRIGAHEQLRIYGRILGVSVHAVGDGEELRQTLADLKDRHMVLIDTAGMSQRDRMVVEQGAMLASSDRVKRLLLLNATSRGDTLDDVIRAYGGEDIAACILSKIDESATLAPAVDAVARHGLAVAYLANGQRVPEDLHLPNRKYLLHRVFKQAPGNMAHRLKPEEVGMALAANGGDHGIG